MCRRRARPITARRTRKYSLRCTISTNSCKKYKSSSHGVRWNPCTPIETNNGCVLLPVPGMGSAKTKSPGHDVIISSAIHVMTIIATMEKAVRAI